MLGVKFGILNSNLTEHPHFLSFFKKNLFRHLEPKCEDFPTPNIISNIKSSPRIIYLHACYVVTATANGQHLQLIFICLLVLFLSPLAAGMRRLHRWFCYKPC